MCVTHVYGLAGAAQVGGPPNLVRTGMFTGHPTPRVGSGAWPIRLGCILGAPKILRGGAALGKSATSGVGGGWAPPPKSRALGVTNCHARTMGHQEAPGGSK